MWLLRVDDATLHHFQEGQAPPYAILSHVWRGEEQSFQAVMAISGSARATLNNDGSTTLPQGLSPKINNFCDYARKRGYKWAWIDTCCIDKSSSAELSEALNSMYSYYAKAEICFAFLDDIRGDEDPREPTAMFRFSAWFKRGWTLQELLAPHAVVFLSSQWQPVGTNHALADVIEEITGIDQTVLTHQLPLREVSVARRMSWASQRKTTRIEDAAYSLMGIFNVFMPTVYGEGARAFTRLQEEILKQLPDQSIFAWGPLIQVDHDTTMQDANRRPLSAESYRSRLAFERHRGLQGLLARSPEDFAHSGNIRPLPFRKLSEALGVQVPVPVYHPTSGGLRMQMPVILPDESRPSPVIPGTSLTVSSAVLACEDEHGNIVVLYLRRESESTDAYSVGLPTDGQYLRAALWSQQARQPQEVQVIDFYVMHRHPSNSPLPYFPLNQSSVADSLQGSGTLSVFFYFPVWVLARLQLNGFSPAISTGARWGIQPLPVEEGVSAEVRCDAATQRTETPNMVASQLFWYAGSIGTSGTVIGSATMRVSFWIGCSCAHRGPVEDIWVDIELDADGAMGTPSRRPPSQYEALTTGGTCHRAHLSRDVSELHFKRGDFDFQCRIVPWCGYPVRPDGIASCEYLMDVSLREPQAMPRGPPIIPSFVYTPPSMPMSRQYPPGFQPYSAAIGYTPAMAPPSLASMAAQFPGPPPMSTPYVRPVGVGPQSPPVPPAPSARRHGAPSAPLSVHFADTPPASSSEEQSGLAAGGPSTASTPAPAVNDSAAATLPPSTLFYDPGVPHYLVPVTGDGWPQVTPPTIPSYYPPVAPPPSMVSPGTLHMPLPRRPLHVRSTPRASSPVIPPPPPMPSEPPGQDGNSSDSSSSTSSTSFSARRARASRRYDDPEARGRPIYRDRPSVSPFQPPCEPVVVIPPPEPILSSDSFPLLGSPRPNGPSPLRPTPIPLPEDKRSSPSHTPVPLPQPDLPAPLTPPAHPSPLPEEEPTGQGILGYFASWWNTG